MTAQIIDTMLRFSGRLEELSDDMQRELFDRRANADPEIASATRDIIERVKETGDDALRALAEQFDGVSLENIEVPRSVIREARDSIDDQLREALEHAAANIRKVHEAQLPVESAVEVERGVFVSRRPDPLNRVGAYAPGGTAAYASSVLMTVIPARAAGVDEIILCSPAGKDGTPAREIMAAAAIAGVDRLFAVGGAGAIAAMAFGTASIPRADRIVGPGNAYVAEAKSQLASYVGIDCPAGPSELLIIADSSVSAYVVAREAIAQAEHDERAVVGIITIGKCEDDILPALRITADSQPRRGIVSEALRTRGFMIQVDTSDEAVRLATRFAPEHLLIVSRDADAIAA